MDSDNKQKQDPQMQDSKTQHEGKEKIIQKPKQDFQVSVENPKVSLNDDNLYTIQGKHLSKVQIVDKNELEKKLKSEEKILLCEPESDDGIKFLRVKVQLPVAPSMYKEMLALKKEMFENNLLNLPTNREFFAEMVREGIRTYKELIKTYANKQNSQDTHDNKGENGFSNEETEIPVY